MQQMLQEHSGWTYQCTSTNRGKNAVTTQLLLRSQMPSPDEASASATKTFRDLGLIEPLLQALDQINFKTPTEIQQQALPYALEGRDVIGVAETGSGKTAAFALPILQKLWEEPKGLFACVLAPTRELAYQISQQFESLGAAMGVRCLVLIGGVDKMPQAVALAKRPHIIVATPGRLNDHLHSTKGFSLRNLKFLVGIHHICVLAGSLFFPCRSWTRLIAFWTWTLVPISTKFSK